ncbi:MAG: hypothetical protein M1824_004651 [Vezdaea acicularis]|nr:MAG: hypothetical protein M1824_004651 [Vezdaea acicularis]
MPLPKADISFTRLLARCLRKIALFIESPYRATIETLIKILTWVANYIENPTPPNRWFMKGLFIIQMAMALSVLVPAATAIQSYWRGHRSYDVYSGSYGSFVRTEPGIKALIYSVKSIYIQT